MSPFASTRSTYCGRFWVAWPQICWPPASTVETRVVTWAIQGPISFVVRKRKSLVRTGRGEADNVAVRASARRDARAELDQDARRIVVRVGDKQWLIDLEIMHIAEPV